MTKGEDTGPLHAAISRAYLADETEIVDAIIPKACLSPAEAAETERMARGLVEGIRANRRIAGGVDALLHEYDLSSEEGVVIMCLAEALLRIPDGATRDALIREKIGPADWERHLGRSDSLFVNASTWGLLLTGRVVRLEDFEGAPASTLLARLISRSGETVIRQAVTHAVRIIGRQFVLGETIGEALERAAPFERQGYRHSYDMLGEAAKTSTDAKRYFEAYKSAAQTIGAKAESTASVFGAPGISVKLSALHPRFEYVKRARLRSELVPRLIALAEAAKSGGIGLTIDAEEADRLDLSLDIFEYLAKDQRLAGWNGLGLAVQGYQKRALAVIEWLTDLAQRTGRQIPTRLVKGAYWDTEIKRAQVAGLCGYPVFTRKSATDTNYLACARALLGRRDAFFPQFATHNAHTVAAVLAISDEASGFEFQRLHGMGQPLYDQIVGKAGPGIAVRTYAPVGGQEHLLAYLVRRLLENGANTSFVNRLADDEAPIETIIADPVAALDHVAAKPHPRIPLPANIFQPNRRNSSGLLLSDPAQSSDLLNAMSEVLAVPFIAEPLVCGKSRAGEARPVTDPADRRRTVGEVSNATDPDIDDAFAAASKAQTAWDAMGGAARAALLERAADLFEANRARLVALIVREAGRTVASALSEVREAADFLRYYAARARESFGAAEPLHGPTGERNELSLHGRGVFACISPWNFPLAIFTGQIAAALAAGNSVIAKPAEQTPLTGALAAQLLLEAGIPAEALHLLPGDGAICVRIIAHPRLAGVAFTGSTATAQAIRQTLAAKDGPIVPLIAETGGINAMFVDSTALLEQAVSDILASAFESAGQRCSAARLLAVQDDIADDLLEMLAGAMDELAIGDPLDLATDIGPVIDNDARAMLEAHAERLKHSGRLIHALGLPPATEHGSFFAPIAFELPSVEVLKEEIFGPVLGIVRYKRGELDRVCERIAAKGFGLTLGIHSRLEETAAHIIARVPAGNVYVNRNQIGAVVGVQPFGGLGLSGTGPQAGGPHTLQAFATERALSVDTTATGGNASLLMLKDEG